MDPLPGSLSAAARAHVEQNDRYGAHNYHPLPVVITRGEGVWLEDVDGKRYLDCLSAYSAVNQGHCHPRLLEALTRQAARLTLTSRAFHNDRLGPFVEKLARLAGMARVLPMNSGAEAVETAVKTARKWGYTVKGVPQDQARIVVFTENFHGRTTTIVSFSTDPVARADYGPFTPGFDVVPYGDLPAVEAALTPETVAILVEPIQGEAGIVVPPAGFLPGLRDLATQHEVLLIADEIQTGLGRTGRMFACEHEGVTPDLYTLGKALGGGFYPVSAVVAREGVLDVFRPGQHGSTFGGNPLACALACEALDILIEEDLPGRAARQGARLMQGLRDLGPEKIAEVRGRGLLIGVVVRREAGKARPYCEALMREGLLCKDTHEQVIRLAPPLVISDDEVDWALERFARVLG